MALNTRDQDLGKIKDLEPSIRSCRVALEESLNDRMVANRAATKLVVLVTLS